MPSDLAITLGLLRFGALEASEKLQVLDEYQAHSDAKGGGPHVWNPCVEVVESLWQETNACAHETAYRDSFKDEDRRLLGQIAALVGDILFHDEHYPRLVDRSVFQTPIGRQLSLLCREAVTRMSTDREELLSFWDLMCYTCD